MFRNHTTHFRNTQIGVLIESVFIENDVPLIWRPLHVKSNTFYKALEKNRRHDKKFKELRGMNRSEHSTKNHSRTWNRWYSIPSLKGKDQREDINNSTHFFSEAYYKSNAVYIQNSTCNIVAHNPWRHNNKLRSRTIYWSYNVTQDQRMHCHDWFFWPPECMGPNLN